MVNPAWSRVSVRVWQSELLYSSDSYPAEEAARLSIALSWDYEIVCWAWQFNRAVGIATARKNATKKRNSILSLIDASIRCHYSGELTSCKSKRGSLLWGNSETAVFVSVSYAYDSVWYDHHNISDSITYSQVKCAPWSNPSYAVTYWHMQCAMTVEVSGLPKVSQMPSENYLKFTKQLQEAWWKPTIKKGYQSCHM